MDPSTGTFISMDSYAGTIYDPVSLHKYLYANANPVMNTDPSGYTSLSELATSISTHVSKIASAVYNSRILRTLSGAVTGAIIGGIDSGLGGNDIKQVFHDALMGAGIGAIGACFLPELLCLVTSCVPKLIALKGMSYLVLLSGGLGVAESLNEGNGKQALFRGILTLVSFIGFRVTIKKLEVYAVETSYGKSNPNSTKPKGWKVGDPIDNLTRTGKEPSWSTVRSRYWKNEAYYNSGYYSETNLARMRKGRAPLHHKYDVPMELHHIYGRNISNPHNIDNLQKVWPWEHDLIDEFRHYIGPKPEGY